MLIILAAAVFLAASWGFFTRGEMEQGNKKLPKGGQTFMLEPLLLPVFFFVMILLLLLLPRTEMVRLRCMGALVVVLMLLCVYYALLLCALPLLRRIFSARACAALYVLPTYLYLLGNLYNLPGTVPPLVLTLPKRWLKWLIPVWLTGFLLILLWQVLSHMVYRRKLLRDAKHVESGDAVLCWRAIRKRYRVKREIPLMVTARTRTPLTIGLFSGTMRLVLPHLNYNPEELELILTHEMRHIQRADTRTKAFLGFCTALCWFNPLMWIARRKVSEDLELSCDELVLNHASQAKRTRYADLLLSTAGDSQGYTTCLSAAASSLRYRLKYVVAPCERQSGTLLVGLVLAALVLGMGGIALADSPDTVQAQIFDRIPADSRIAQIYVHDAAASGMIYRWQEEPLTKYLSSLTVRQIYSRDFSPPTISNGHELDVTYTLEQDGKTTSRTTLDLYDGMLCVYLPYAVTKEGDQTYVSADYIVESEIDWDYMESLLDFDAPNPDPAPQPPEMTVEFSGEDMHWTEKLYAERTVVYMERGGEKQTSGLAADGVGGISGFPAVRARLNFSYRPVQDDYQVRVENWDRTEVYTVQSSELTDGVLELAPYSAHYTVLGRFCTVRDTTYDMEFFFDVELPEE